MNNEPIIKEGDAKMSTKSMYYYFATKVFAPDGNLKKLGILNVDYKDEILTGWGMFASSRVAKLDNGEMCDAMMRVTFTPESGRSSILLVGREMIIAFMQLQDMKVSATNEEDIKMLALIEDNLDDELIINIGFKSGKPVTGSVSIIQYISLLYHGFNAVQALASRLMSEMSNGICSIKAEQPVKITIWSKIKNLLKSWKR